MKPLEFDKTPREIEAENQKSMLSLTIGTLIKDGLKNADRIEMLQREIVTQTQLRNEVRSRILELEYTTMQEVCAEVDDKGKQVYSNDPLRKAETYLRLINNALYVDATGIEAGATQNIGYAEAEVDRLKTYKQWQLPELSLLITQFGDVAGR